MKRTYITTDSERLKNLKQSNLLKPCGQIVPEPQHSNPLLTLKNGNHMQKTKRQGVFEVNQSAKLQNIIQSLCAANMSRKHAQKIVDILIESGALQFSEAQKKKSLSVDGTHFVAPDALLPRLLVKFSAQQARQQISQKERNIYNVKICEHKKGGNG